MRTRAASWVVILVGVTLAGCLAEPEDGLGDLPGGDLVDLDEIARLIGEPVIVDHDHSDVNLHIQSFNLEFVSWSTLGVTLGENGFANFVFYEDADETLAFVSIDGDQRGGFTIADVADPLNITPLGHYRVAGSGFQEVRVTPDGRFALMNVQERPGDVEMAGDCTVCIHIVDVEDRSNPQLVGVVPVELIGTHNLHVEEIDGDVYVFYVAQPLYQPTPIGSNPAVGNEVVIGRFVESPDGSATIVRVAEYRHEDALTDLERSFPHDVIVEVNPLSGQRVAYVSHWQGGAITVDVSNPLAPMELDVHADPAPSEVSNIHWFAPEPAPRGDRLIAWSAPEIGALNSGSGVIRAYDVADPAQLRQIGTWQLPGNVTIPAQFVLSPHITQADSSRGLLAVSHYHAGVWILDIQDPSQPRQVGYYMPHGDPDHPYEGDLWWKKPNFDPEGFFPNVYQARWKDDLLWVTERGSGMYVLDYTGPHGGPVGE